MVRAPDWKSVGRGLKSRPDRYLMLFMVAPTSTSRHRFVNSQLACLPPIEILNLVLFI